MGRKIREEPAESGDGGWAVQAVAEKLARAGGASRQADDSSKKPGPVKLG